MAKYLDLAGLQSYNVKIIDALNNKVDKVTGKQLSTEDYTTAEKNKLAGLSKLAPASTQKLGGIKVGNNLTVTAEGVLSAPKPNTITITENPDGTVNLDIS